MKTELIDSIKARLYDYKYSPFLSTYLFFWLFLNSKLILIYFDDALDVNKKIEMLSWSDVNIIDPAIYAGLYVVLFPIIKVAAYGITLAYENWMNIIKIAFEKGNPMPLEEAVKLRKKYLDIEIENDKLIEDIDNVNKKNHSEIEKIKNRVLEKEQNLKKEIEEAIQKEANKYNKEIEKLIDEKEALQKRIDSLEKNKNYSPAYAKKVNNEFEELFGIEQKKPEEYLNELDDIDIKLINVFYDINSNINIGTFKDAAKDNYGIPKALVDNRMKKLKEKGLVSINNISYVLTSEGVSILEYVHDKLVKENKDDN